MATALHFRVNSPPVVLETVDEETIIVNLDSGSYYDLDHVGGHVLHRLAEGSDLDEVVLSVASRWNTDADRVAAPVRALVEELVAEGILNPSPAPESNGHGAPAQPPSARPYEDPKLGKYTDMQELLLLDPVHEVDEAGWPNKA